MKKFVKNVLQFFYLQHFPEFPYDFEPAPIIAINNGNQDYLLFYRCATLEFMQYCIHFCIVHTHVYHVYIQYVLHGIMLFLYTCIIYIFGVMSFYFRTLIYNDIALRVLHAHIYVHVHGNFCRALFSSKIFCEIFLKHYWLGNCCYAHCCYGYSVVVCGGL